MIKNYTSLFVATALLLGSHFCKAQAVGIGTSTPSAGAALDVTSTNKGLLLPRLSDTTAVASPTAGLMIYNNNTKLPAFHNGTAWQSLASMANTNTLATDSLTYSITGPATPAYTSGQFRAAGIAVSSGTPNPGVGGIAGTFSKYLDINSSPLQQMFMLNNLLGTVEFFYYRQGSATPYKSIKFKTLGFTSFQFGFNDNGQSASIMKTTHFNVVFTVLKTG